MDIDYSVQILLGWLILNFLDSFLEVQFQVTNSLFNMADQHILYLDRGCVKWLKIEMDILTKFILANHTLDLK